MQVLTISRFLDGKTINPNFGGKDVISLEVINALVEDGHHVYVLPWNDEKVWEEIKFRIKDDASYAVCLPTLHFPDLSELAKKILFSSFQKKALKNPKKHVWKIIHDSLYDKEVFLKKAMDRSNPDVVHVHYTHSDFPKHYREQNYTAPILLTHHSQGISDSLPEYDYVAFISRFQYNEAIQKFPEIESRSCVISNCVNDVFLKSFEPVKSKKIIYLSILVRHKGIDILLRSFAANNKLRNFNLSVIGEGKSEQEFKNFATEHELKNVDFLGRLSIRGNLKEMQEASLFVVPSRGEGFGIIYAEALCMGLPIIGYPSSVRELSGLLDMEVGYEFDAINDNAEYLAELILKAMNSEITTVSYRKELMRRAHNQFSRKKFKEKYLNFYQRILEESASKSVNRK